MPPAEGRPTRGTTGTNRLRRVDRWIAGQRVLRQAADPLVVDLGFGASATTVLELAARLAPVRAGIEVVGVEIDPDRVARARGELERVRAGGTAFAPDTPVTFLRGGFEVPLEAGRRAAVIRCFNVLRQYDEDEVPAAWRSMAARLQPSGVLVEGTCDEIGRLSTWVAVGSDAVPRTLTISVDLRHLDRPSTVAERLPKALIHRNVPGEGVHALLAAMDAHWDRASALAPFGPVQRWRELCRRLAADGWPLQDSDRRWRLGEVTVDWAAVRTLGV